MKRPSLLVLEGKKNWSILLRYRSPKRALNLLESTDVIIKKSKSLPIDTIYTKIIKNYRVQPDE